MRAVQCSREALCNAPSRPPNRKIGRCVVSALHSAGDYFRRRFKRKVAEPSASAAVVRAAGAGMLCGWMVAEALSDDADGSSLTRMDALGASVGRGVGAPLPEESIAKASSVRQNALGTADLDSGGCFDKKTAMSLGPVGEDFTLV